MLVVIVVLVFLQSWRASLIPLLAVPVSLIGTFAVMWPLGLLAQQPVAVRAGAGDRHRRGRRDRRRRERRALDRAGLRAARGGVQGDGRGDRPPSSPSRSGLSAVFIPVAFISGITGQFYRQFALTIAVATLISRVQLADAQPRAGGAAAQAAARQAGLVHAGARTSLLGWFFRLFNRALDVSDARRTSRRSGASCGSAAIALLRLRRAARG